MKLRSSQDSAFKLQENFLHDPLMAAIKLARYKFVAKILSKNDKVLDLGCGNGYGSYFFSKIAKQVTGLDLYADVKKAQNLFNAPNIKFVQGDIVAPPNVIAQNRFSAITAIDVIEHFYRGDGENIIEMYSRLLTENGIFIIGTPSKFSQSYRSKISKENHCYEYEPEELNDICGKFFGRTILLSMNDEIVHTGFSKLAWFFFVLCFK